MVVPLCEIGDGFHVEVVRILGVLVAARKVVAAEALVHQPF